MVRVHTTTVTLSLIISIVVPSFAEESWPSNVKGHVALKPGEHPRLLFRKSELPELRARANSPEGRAILKRLGVLLNGGDGRSMPEAYNPVVGQASRDGSGASGKSPPGMYTFSHAAGYGLLYQLTGDRKYADLGRQCMEKALEGYRDRDNRYAFKHPYGALRAGPSLGWTALGYDLCYDGWDEAFRRRMTDALFNYQGSSSGQTFDLEYLVKGKRHFPASNHWGMQVGGGALALLAVMGDPGTGSKKVQELLQASEQSMIRNMTEGFGDGGYFAEGDGTGSMASHIVFLTALQAWKHTAGKDFIGPRPNAQWMALKWILLTIPREMDRGKLAKGFTGRGGYPHNIWDRDGISGGGYFSIGYGAVRAEQMPALWWFYNRHLKDWDDQNGTPWDAVSPYPHHAVIAFVNTPFGMTPVNPAECMPRNVRDGKHGFFGFRNRWQDGDDIVITQLTKRSPARFRHGPDRNLIIQHHGKTEKWGSIPSPVSHWQPAGDGSAVVGDGKTFLAIDFSTASGADGMLVMTGPAASADTVVEAGGQTYSFKFLTKGKAPSPQVQGDKVVAGKQTVAMRDGKLVLGVFADPWTGPSKKAVDAARR